MLRVCVALGILAASVCGQWSVPLHHGLFPAMPRSLLQFPTLRPFYEAKRTSTSGTEEVVWLAACSPRLGFVNRRQDAQLQCQAVVPADTEVIWLKNNVPLLSQGEQVQQEAYEESTNHVDVSLAPAANPQGARLRVVPVVYIDCADQSDEGEYSLEMRTPTNNVYFRNFTLRILSMRQEGSTCNVQATQLESQPRIYLHASWAWPVVGGSLTLPCRAHGSNLQHTWYVDNTYVGNTNPNYQVLASGDLIIRTVGRHSPTSSRCQVTSTDGTGPMDAITTNIRVRSQ